MRVHHSIEALPVFRKAVVTIGTFDGVHLGHQTILQQLKEEAARIDGETVIITFHPHPRKIVSSGHHTLRLLNTIEERTDLLERAGIDHLVVVPFTPAFSLMSPEAYITDFLCRYFHPHTIIIGYDHRFGKERTGNYTLMETYSEKMGFNLKEIPEHIINNNTVSSTHIREALLQGQIAAANELLGYDYSFEGEVVEGNKLGRTLGYPTANLSIQHPEKLVPGDGVYAVQVLLENDQDHPGKLNGMMNIGNRPTVDGTKRVIEVNIFDFDQDIYHTTLRVFVIQRLRGEQKFNGLEALKEQLAKDQQAAMEVLSGK